MSSQYCSVMTCAIMSMRRFFFHITFVIPHYLRDSERLWAVRGARFRILSVRVCAPLQYTATASSLPQHLRDLGMRSFFGIRDKVRIICGNWAGRDGAAHIWTMMRGHNQGALHLPCALLSLATFIMTLQAKTGVESISARLSASQQPPDFGRPAPVGPSADATAAGRLALHAGWRARH